MPTPEYTWASQAYFGRRCQACDYELKCSPPPGYPENTRITIAYENKVCPKCKSEAFDFGSMRHARDCECWYCTHEDD